MDVKNWLVLDVLEEIEGEITHEMLPEHTHKQKKTEENAREIPLVENAGGDARFRALVAERTEEFVEVVAVEGSSWVCGRVDRPATSRTATVLLSNLLDEIAVELVQVVDELPLEGGELVFRTPLSAGRPLGGSPPASEQFGDLLGLKDNNLRNCWKECSRLAAGPLP